MYKVTTSNRFDKDLKRIKSDKVLVDEIFAVVGLLSENDIQIPEKYRDHALKGKYIKYRECHIRPNWLLIYRKNKNELVLMLVRTGTHALLFK